MARRRTRCPRCGNPVGVPSLEPIHPGGLPPLTPLQRELLARKRRAANGGAPPEQPEPPPQPPRESYRVRLLSAKAKRRAELKGRHLEKHWYECLAYPLRAIRLCLALALFLAACSAGVALLLPAVYAAPVPEDPSALSLYYAAGALAGILLFALPCTFLDCVLVSAVAGEIFYIRWSGNPLLTLLHSGARWLSCFLAGPVLFAALGWLYWLQCGDPGWLDWLILAELGLVGVTYWVYALLAACDGGIRAGLNPVAVIDLAHGLGGRALLEVLVAALAFLGHGWALLAGVARVHDEPVSGLVIVTAAWLSAVFWGTFFCRLLGVGCFLSRLAPAEEGSTAPAA